MILVKGTLSRNLSRNAGENVAAPETAETVLCSEASVGICRQVK
jgi:hypothetical protein